MSTSRRELLRWQFDLTWSLFEFHLDRLQPDDFLWQPAGLCWTVHERTDGLWTPDWDETEPDPIPVPTIAWVMWHIEWWWTVTLDHVQGRTPRDRTEIRWPGSGEASIARLRDLHDEWVVVLDTTTDEHLDSPAPFPWQGDPDMTVAHTVAWVDVELTKNVAEIGQLRLLRHART
ncbi:DinB family protein [Rhodococcus artemisiae]|uniref:DinB family protein n=1 Tax=Rhodococcus artemisiae TaxID=714159 RepID=A0ABU7LDU7_9NOCA|nr:DinB family protein [Rhodococcus artemisiae]MEE2059735.1 DinB family protein [Rhodococcus artemisiae]